MIGETLFTIGAIFCFAVGILNIIVILKDIAKSMQVMAYQLTMISYWLSFETTEDDPDPAEEHTDQETKVINLHPNKKAT